MVLTREPGGTPEGERLRAALLAAGADWSAEAELLLMTAARVEHVRRVIRPALARGALVVSDRFVGSTLAYQGAGRGLPDAMILQLHDTMVALWPDLTIVLDIDPVAGLARSRRRLDTAALDEGRFEAEGTAFHRRLRDSYLRQAAAARHPHAVIDAAQPARQVQAAALAAVTGAAHA